MCSSDLQGEIMGQITIYLENDIENKMKTAAKTSHLSVSKWISKIIQDNISTEWSQDIVCLAGSWKKDFPTLEEIRSIQAVDSDREEL